MKTSNNYCNFFLCIRCLIRLPIYIGQNCWKLMKMTKMLTGDHRYDCNCFRRLLYTPWVTSHPNIIAVNRILQKIPWFLVNSCLFWHFWENWHIRHPISKFSQHPLTKNSENVLHALKSPHTKYHVIIITSSKKIQFWRSCGWRTPFEITTTVF